MHFFYYMKDLVVKDNLMKFGIISNHRFLSDEGPMLETLDHTIRTGSTPTFLYFFEVRLKVLE